MLLNLEPDHLDRHGTFEAYRDAKLRIFERQAAEDTAVVPHGFAPVGGHARRVEFGATDPLPAEPGLPGLHNRENAAAATAAARAAGLPDDAIAEALRTFPGVAHRLELVAEVGGVRYVNDSKATNTAAARRALAAYDVPLHVILGGSRKGRAVRRARRGGARPGVPDRRDGGGAGGGARPRRRPVRTMRRARRGRRGRPRRRPVPARSCCSRRPARATTSSRTSSSAARSSGGWCRTCPGEARTARVEHPRPRHAGPRRLRAGDGVQRDVGVGGDRRRQPDLLPQAPGDLRAARARAARCDRVALELPVAAAPGARPRPGQPAAARRRARRRTEHQRRPPLDPVRRP